MALETDSSPRSSSEDFLVLVEANRQVALKIVLFVRKSGEHRKEKSERGSSDRTESGYASETRDGSANSQRTGSASKSGQQGLSWFPPPPTEVSSDLDPPPIVATESDCSCLLNCAASTLISALIVNLQITIAQNMCR